MYMARESYVDARIGDAAGFVELIGREEMPPPGERRYEGFLVWRALIVEPNREVTAHEWLEEKFAVYAYFPHFTKKVRVGRTRKHRMVARAVIPGMLLIPDEMLHRRRIDEMLTFAHVIGFLRDGANAPARIPKAEVEKIRVMEGKLNVNVGVFDAKGNKLTPGATVEFVDRAYRDSWGTATVFEVASEGRIGVEVACLFGRPGKVYVPAPEIEVM